MTEKRFEATILILLVISVVLTIAIVQKLGNRPHPNKIAKDYIETNINTLSNDIRVHMSFQIPAIAQINPEQINELIQDNSKFQYSESQHIRGETH